MALSLDMTKEALALSGRLVNEHKIKGDDIAFGYNAALHYVFDEQWRVGLSFRSGIRAKIKGDSKFQRQVPGTAQFNSKGHGTLNLPAVLSLGVNYAPIPKLDFEVGFVRIFWSEYKELDLHFDAPLNITLRLGKRPEYLHA